MQSGEDSERLSETISVQGTSFEINNPSVLWQDDCGLLAIRNATLDDSLNLDGLLSVVRPPQKDLQESVVSTDTNFLEEGTGNFNGIGLMHYLESRGYACVLGRTHMGDLLELLCLSLTSRVVGVVWHEGSKTTGHWLCASYSHSEVDFNRRAWFHKDSVGPVVKGVKTSDVINILNDAVEKDQDCFIILNCK